MHRHLRLLVSPLTIVSLRVIIVDVDVVIVDYLKMYFARRAFAESSSI
jgi:hypothetical protein